MTPLYAVLLLHIAAAATWFGMPLSHARRVRLAVAEKDRSARVGGLQAIARELNAALGAAGGTLVTGFALVFLDGGFAAVPKTIHAAMGIAILLFALTFFFRTRIVALEATPSDAGAGERGARALAPISGIMQLLWLVILGLMLAQKLPVS